MRVASLLLLSALTACSATSPVVDAGPADVPEDARVPSDISRADALDAALPSDIPTVDAPSLDVVYDAGPCQDCVAATVSWGYEGGYDAGVALRSEVRGCREFRALRQSFSTGVTDATCVGTVGDCAAADGIAGLQRALAHPDVAAALAETSPFFGRNQSGTDIAFLRVRVGERSLAVGSPCEGACDAGVRAIPPGVAALKQFLDAFAAAQGARCAPPDAGTLADAGIVCGAVASSFPTFDDACGSDGDCAVAVHQTDCCGNQRGLGIAASQRAAFDAAEAICRPMYPRCGCPTQGILCDDDRRTFDPNGIGVACRAGRCTTFVR